MAATATTTSPSQKKPQECNANTKTTKIHRPFENVKYIVIVIICVSLVTIHQNERILRQFPFQALTTTKLSQHHDEHTKNNDNDENDMPNKIDKPLNILLLYADDWRHDSLGVASNGLVHTPFLDYLSTQGIRFTHNCVTTATCWISRATLYMGQYLSRHQSPNPDEPNFYPHWRFSYPMILRNHAKYHIGHVGKWHFVDYDKISHTFHYEKMYYGYHWYPDYDSPNFNPTTQKPIIHSTKKNEQDAMEFLTTRPKDKPFCLTVAFFTPHAVDHEDDQYQPQPTSMHLYNTTTIPRAANAYAAYYPSFFHPENNEGKRRYNWRFDTSSKYQTMMKNYYRLISEIDQSSETIYKELERQGILNETLVIFTTDNGYFHAEHGLADKWYPYQESIRVPLIIQDPRMPNSKKGTINSDFTLNIDLAPTLLSAAMVPKYLMNKTMQGRDIAELYLTKNNYTTPLWRQSFYYEHPVHLREDIIPESQALVRKDYKYIKWPSIENREQLFHLKSDPFEDRDLMLLMDETHQYDHILAEMRYEFKKLQQAAQ